MDTHIKPTQRRRSNDSATGHEGWLTNPPTGQEPLHIPVVRHNAPHPLRHIKTPRAVSVPQRVARAKPIPPQGCSGAWGSCISHPDCPDTNCEGHPDNATEPGDVDPALRAHFWRLYLIGAAACPCSRCWHWFEQDPPMASVHMTFTDTPTGGVEVHTDFTPTVGAPCSKAQAVALEIFNRTRRDWQLAGTEDGGITTTSARIKREAAQAAQCYTDVLSACPYPLSSEAGKMFQLHFQVALDLKKSARQEAAA